MKYAVRALLKDGWQTLVVLISMAFAMTSVITVATLINNTMLRKAPVRDGYRLVEIYSVNHTGAEQLLSYPEYEQIKEHSRSLEGACAYFTDMIAFQEESKTRALFGSFVDDACLSQLTSPPSLGTLSLNSEAGSSSVTSGVVIGYRMWQKYYGRSNSVVGRPIVINRNVFQILGVAPERFEGFSLIPRPDVFLPMRTAQQLLPGFSLIDRNNRAFNVIGRLRPGATLGEVKAEEATVAQQLELSFPVFNKDRSFHVVPFDMMPVDLRSALRRFLVFALFLVSIVLIISCANVSGLLLASNVSRNKQVAIRYAMGATWSKIAKNVFIQNLILSAVSGIFGAVLSVLVLRTISTFLPLGLPLRLFERLDVSFLAELNSQICVAGILLTIPIIISIRRLDVAGELKDIGVSRRSAPFKLFPVILSIQIAGSLVFLSLAVLAFGSLNKAFKNYPGYPSANIVAVNVLPGTVSPAGPPDPALFGLLDQVKRLPVVQSATVAARLPLDLAGNSAVVAILNDSSQLEASQPGSDTKEGLPAHYNAIGPDFFATLQIPLLAGREFSVRDTATSRPVAIVNDIAAKLLWRSEAALGRPIMLAFPGRPRYEVIGVVESGKYDSNRGLPQPYIYLPVSQMRQGNLALIARSKSSPAEAGQAIEHLIDSVDPSLPIISTVTVRDGLSLLFLIPAVTSVAFGFLGGMATILSLIGLHALMQFSVSSRAGEIGLRMALGATRAAIIRLFISRGARLVFFGIATGILPAFLGTRVMTHVLYGSAAKFPVVSFVFVAAALFLVALSAIFIPSFRAGSMDPVKTLIHR